MLTHESPLGYGVWDSGNGIVVEYSLDVLEELRRRAVEGCSAFAHGGKETGGVLYGIREPGCVRLQSFGELDCEHALGPRFVLSEKDRSALLDLMQAPSGVQVVGWYRAHTRGDLDLDAHDREMFDRHFAESMSLGLILKPTRW